MTWNGIQSTMLRKAKKLIIANLNRNRKARKISQYIIQTGEMEVTT